RPQSARQFFADDRHLRRIDCVLRAEISPTKKRRADGLEISRADGKIAREGPFVRRNLPAFGDDTSAERHKTERENIGHTRRLGAWQPFKSLDNLPVKLPAFGFVVTLKPEIERNLQHIIRFEAQIDLSRIL